MFRAKALKQVGRMIARCESPANELQRRGKCLNSVQLIGYTGADPQSFGTDSHSGTRLSLATTSYYRTKDDKLHSKTSWHNISVFKPSLQEKVNLHVRRGSRLFVQGSLDYTSYVDQDGQKKYSTSIIPNDIIILNSRPSPEEEEDF
ncbi:single-stranded DNA-binding protein 1-A, mitochondrial [Nematostella vectensis]|uniref:single-stranded DNA-binding protein 1-A, mitochondrial n=1 Tax=Nematostella vectensis TaxID=45351 RepID=UPI00207721D0|nr:single-stranded DNA-binding protein 1-A, mitochondrial [Nematostella vectensis]XP_032234071.2 single-stranded DNA-binding protein 1-A, mitochondrial [Nematostella vectensis]